MSKISVKELQARLRAAADTTDEQSLIVQSCAAIEALQAERDALAAKLAELEGQEPIGYVSDDALASLRAKTPGAPPIWPQTTARNHHPIFARPFPAEQPVNARLLDALKLAECVYRKNVVNEGEPSSVLEAMQAAITAAEAQRPTDYSSTVDRAWARFCGAFGDGPDAPYPGMIAAFETHYGQSFRDREWRTESACWAAAWHRATEHAAKQTEPVRLTGDQLEGLVKWYGEEPNIYLDRREYARTIQDEVLRANGYKVEG